jgi:hypothetical protein
VHHWQFRSWVQQQLEISKVLLQENHRVNLLLQQGGGGSWGDSDDDDDRLLVSQKRDDSDACCNSPSLQPLMWTMLLLVHTQYACAQQEELLQKGDDQACCDSPNLQLWKRMLLLVHTEECEQQQQQQKELLHSSREPSSFALRGSGCVATRRKWWALQVHNLVGEKTPVVLGGY